MKKMIFEKEEDSKDLIASPYFAESFESIPPAYIFVGGIDPLKDEAIFYHKKLRENKVPSTLSNYINCPHDWLISLETNEKIEARHEFIFALRRAFGETPKVQYSLIPEFK